MEFIILTGVSGAGKSICLNFFEDMGYYCVDNLPPALMRKFAEMCDDSGDIHKVVLGIDIRGGKLFNDFLDELEEFRKTEECSLLFLDCADSVLVKRFKENRREHPLSKGDRIIKGINEERELLLTIKEESDYIIDTTNLLTRQLKEELINIFEKERQGNIAISVMSFGFKHGVPNDVDLVFDVRFIPNPFYVAELKNKTGETAEVQEYVLSHPEAVEFLEMLCNMVTYLLPYYAKEGKNALVIGIGCTGGKHRSVTLANKLYSKLVNDGNLVRLSHNDIEK
ncbi:MAG: RNase adapter RapZ [Lachnospirales bacterium]